jgi:phage-related baseplate assembly protein
LSVENLIVTKLLAGRPRDKEDVREIVAGRPSIDHSKVEDLLDLLEAALDQSDLRPLYAQLRVEAAGRTKSKTRS